MSQTDWYILFLSALPITELRATIPLALALGVSPLRAYLLAVIGNLIPVLPVILLLEPLSRLLRWFPPLERLFQAILSRSRNKGAKVHKYGVLGLMLFVAVPLPVTGAWTGAILAWLFGFNALMAFLSILGGVLIAGFLVSLASLGVLKMAFLFDWSTLIIILVLAAIIFLWYKSREKSKRK